MHHPAAAYWPLRLIHLLLDSVLPPTLYLVDSACALTQLPQKPVPDLTVTALEIELVVRSLETRSTVEAVARRLARPAAVSHRQELESLLH